MEAPSRNLQQQQQAQPAWYAAPRPMVHDLPHMQATPNLCQNKGQSTEADLIIGTWQYDRNDGTVGTFDIFAGPRSNLVYHKEGSIKHHDYRYVRGDLLKRHDHLFVVNKFVADDGRVNECVQMHLKHDVRSDTVSRYVAHDMNQEWDRHDCIRIPLTKSSLPSTMFTEVPDTRPAIIDSGALITTLPQQMETVDQQFPFRPAEISGIWLRDCANAVFESLQRNDVRKAQDYFNWVAERCSEQPDKACVKHSVFMLMDFEDCRWFMEHVDNLLYKGIQDNVRNMIEHVYDSAAVPVLSNPGKATKVFQSLVPMVMDQSCREPATTTPYGHTSTMKLLTFKLLKIVGFTEIAVTGQYYADTYTPETQFVEELHKNGLLDGTVAMFGPSVQNRAAGMKLMREYPIPNAFLDVGLQGSIRFGDSDNICQDVLNAVVEIDEIFNGRGYEQKHHLRRNMQDTPRGEVSVNLVDLMEFLDLKADGEMDPEKKASMIKIFRTWLNDDLFNQRVCAILTEEGRGRATYGDYGTISKWLREFFPRDRFRILVHAHAGDGNTQDAASIDAVSHGADGVWAGFIPHAAQGGHNSSFVFLDNCYQNGNPCIRELNLAHGIEIARRFYALNFNDINIPDDCPIWGKRPGQIVHQAFQISSGETWRQRGPELYGQCSAQLRSKLMEEWKQLMPAQEQKDKYYQSLNDDHEENYFEATTRIAPLVSDDTTWQIRIQEMNVVSNRDLLDLRCNPEVFSQSVRCIAFALMNGDVRANFNSHATVARCKEILLKRKGKYFIKATASNKPNAASGH